ncbi:MAG: branched-chain amino acid aminotransferase [Candidatus Thorarchaeota archaeon]|nr:branched-chain amino acid aminotransferase [Candidatus Thorarchaeota archaeon]
MCATACVRALELRIDRVPSGKAKAKPNDPMQVPFGTVFTDHMFIMEYSDGQWHDARIQPYGPLMLDPAALVLHYGQGIFEGMKAYRRGKRVFLFRPEMNLERLNRSAARMVMPTVDVSFVLSALKSLLRIERDWIPDVAGASLYIRPTMIASEARLGVKAAQQYLLYVILSPVGPYFKEGFSPIKVLVSDKYVRAARGGTGSAKTMGNYAMGLLAGKEASDSGHSQVLWLDAIERKYLEEAGTMNVFAVIDGEVLTPPLKDTILPGVTRDSVIELARQWGYTVHERELSIDEVISGVHANRVQELFGTGTAAVIAPIGMFTYKSKSYTVGEGKAGPLSRRLFEELMGLQCGERRDTHGWIVEVE